MEHDFVDGWFMGVTPTLVTGTWVGGEDRWIRFLDLGNGQGGRLARPYFTEFMKHFRNFKLGCTFEKIFELHVKVKKTPTFYFGILLKFQNMLFQPLFFQDE